MLRRVVAGGRPVVDLVPGQVGRSSPDPKRDSPRQRARAPPRPTASRNSPSGRASAANLLKPLRERDTSAIVPPQTYSQEARRPFLGDQAAMSRCGDLGPRLCVPPFRAVCLFQKRKRPDRSELLHQRTSIRTTASQATFRRFQILCTSTRSNDVFFVPPSSDPGVIPRSSRSLAREPNGPLQGLFHDNSIMTLEWKLTQIKFRSRKGLRAWSVGGRRTDVRIAGTARGNAAESDG